MPGPVVSDGFKLPIHDQISELQRKIQLLEGDRSAYFESSQSAIKKNRETILQLRQENKNLHKKLAEDDEQMIKEVFQGPGMEKASFRNMPMKAARTVLEKQVRDKVKKLNAMKHITQKSQQRFDELKLQFNHMKPRNKSAQPDSQKQDQDNQKLRILENRLEKTTLKFHEAEHITRGYLKLKDHLQEENLTYQPQLDRMEAEVQRQAKALKELQVMNSDAHLSKNAAKAELQLQEEQVYRERREREKILSQYKKQTVERMAQAERMKRRTQWGGMHQDELSSDAQRSTTAVGEEVETTSAFEEAFQRIKDATEITDSQEMVERFISQGQTQEHLNRVKVENERRLLELKQERDTLQKQLQEMKYSREAEFSSTQQTLQEFEDGLKQEQQRCDAAEDQLDKLTQTQNTIRAGVQQLSGRFQLIALAPGSQLSSNSDEEMLQLLSEVAQKLIILKDELQGKDLATIVKEIEEEEFQASIVRKIPAYNTHILLNETRNLETFVEKEDSGDDEGDIITRTSLKHQSQSIVDGNSKRKTRLKKRKGKL